MSEYQIIVSEKYREAQDRLLLDPMFTQLLGEVPLAYLEELLNKDGSGFNNSLRNEYRRRGGIVGVHGLGDYYKAAQLWVDSKTFPE
jgi:hypothetical protein